MDKQKNKQKKAEIAYKRLEDLFGRTEWASRGDAVDVLIGTILSANTNNANSHRAFRELRARFEDWDAVRHAPPEEVKDAIRVSGMYNQKAPRILAALERIQADQGEYSLAHLGEMDVDEALDYLTSFPGVGHKTASIVLLFCFNLGTFPVDTHIQRISQRLGISDHKASPGQVTQEWERLMPPETYYPLHIYLIRHGREICQARRPKCEICPLQDVCDYYNRAGEWAPGS